MKTQWLALLWSTVLASACGSNEGTNDELAKQAITGTEEGQLTLERLEADLADLDRKISAAIDSVVASQTDADRANSTAKLSQLQREKFELEQRIAQARIKWANVERLQHGRVR